MNALQVSTSLLVLEICKILPLGFSFSSSRAEMNRERKDGRKIKINKLLALECQLFGVSFPL